MTILKRIFLATLIMLFYTTPTTTYAVSEKMSTYSQIGGGLVAGAVAGLASHITMKKPLITTLIGLGVGGLSWLILHHYLSQLTPTGRMNAATKVMKWVESDSFLSQNFATMEEFITYINTHFGSNHSLTAARKQLEKLHDGCQEALSLANQALQDTNEKDAKTTCENFIGKTSDLVQALKIKSSWATVREVEVNLCKIEENQIFSHDFATDEDLINYVTTSFETACPLALAYNHAMDLKKVLENSLQTIELVSHETLENNSPGITATCKDFSARIQLLLNALANRINLISIHKDYKFQALLYEKNQLDEQVKELKGQCSHLHGQLHDLQRQVSSLRLQTQQQYIRELQMQNGLLLKR